MDCRGVRPDCGRAPRLLDQRGCIMRALSGRWGMVGVGLLMLGVGGCAADVYDAGVYAGEPAPAGYAVYGEPYPYTTYAYPYYGYSGYAYPHSHWRSGDGWHGLHDGGDWRHDHGEWR